jgi:hypothetical protein
LWIATASIKSAKRSRSPSLKVPDVAGVLPLAEPNGLAEGLREELSEEDMGFGSYFLGRALYPYHAGQNKVRQTQQSVLGALFRAMPELSE